MLVAPPHIFPPLPYSSIVFPHSILVSPLSHIPLYFISSSLGDTISPTPHPGSLIMPLTLRVQHMYLRHSLSHVSTPPVCMCVGGVCVDMCAHTENNPLLTPYGFQVSNSGPWGSSKQLYSLGYPAKPSFAHSVSICIFTSLVHFVDTKSSLASSVKSVCCRIPSLFTRVECINA